MKRKHKKEKGVADYFSCAYCLDRYGSWRRYFYFAQGHIKWKEILITERETITTWIENDPLSVNSRMFCINIILPMPIFRQE